MKQVLLACRVESFSPGDGERLRILRPATGVRQMSFKDLKKNYTPPSRVVIKLPRYDYDEIIDALEGEEDDAADSGGEDYELAG